MRQDFPTRKLWEWPWQWVHEYVPDQVHRVILPVGTMEAHGVIPLATDTLIPLALAESCAKELESVIAPPVYYGLTSSLRWYPGSMTMKESVFEAYLYSILEGLAHMGFYEILVFNGHGGQTAQIASCAKKLHHATRVRILVVQWWEIEMPDDVHPLPEPGGHGGRAETALIRAAFPELCYSSFNTSTLLAHRHRGFHVYPFPGPIMQLGEENFDIPSQETSQAFFEVIRKALIEKIKDIFSFWQQREQDADL